MSERKLTIGMHLVFIDALRRERAALLSAIHGDPQGRLVIPRRKSLDDASEEEKAKGYTDANGIYCYETDDQGNIISDYIEPGEHWPCVNLVVISDNEDAQDQYGRQIDDRHTSIVHWTDSTAVGYCYRFADENVDWSKMQPTVS